MAGKRIQYQVVGRYLNGTEVVGYHLQSIDTGKAGRYTREQVCYLVGRDQVTNCTGQIYQDKVLLRGKGISLEDLPAVNEKGDTKNIDKVPRNSTVAQAIEQFRVIGSLKEGRNTVGYVIQNAGGGTAKITRDQLIGLISQGKIANARVQNYNGKVLIRGAGCNLDELPSQQIKINGQAGNKNAPTQATQATQKTASTARKPVASSNTTVNNDEEAPFKIFYMITNLAHRIKKNGHRVNDINKVSGDGKTTIWAKITYDDQNEVDVRVANGKIRLLWSEKGNKIVDRTDDYANLAELELLIIGIADMVN